MVRKNLQLASSNPKAFLSWFELNFAVIVQVLCQNRKNRCMLKKTTISSQGEWFYVK